jgi:hypothetical protein
MVLTTLPKGLQSSTSSSSVHSHGMFRRCSTLDGVCVYRNCVVDPNGILASSDGPLSGGRARSGGAGAARVRVWWLVLSRRGGGDESRVEVRLLRDRRGRDWVCVMGIVEMAGLGLDDTRGRRRRLG